jgi:hypothetical protein
MGKHGSMARAERDFYPTPRWVIEALGEYVELAGKTIWECACGDGRMAEAFKALGATSVHASDIADYAYPASRRLDFLTATAPLVADIDLIATNPPFGAQGKLAVKFVEAGLRLIAGREMLALLLPADFDSGVTRRHLFADCAAFLGKIVLLDRIVWYPNADPSKENPKENCAWFLWTNGPHDGARILYANTRRPKRLRPIDRAQHIITETEAGVLRV